MKNILRTFALLFILINNSCKAQQMVQTTNDVYLLKTNEQQFINKPLKNLLKEIKPEIKTGYASNDNPFFFRFKFITHDQQKKKKKEGSWEDQVSLYVYVKDPIDWKWEKRPKTIGLSWTKEDAEKYGNLTLIRIKVISPPRE
jgi:hypothetical protein